MQIFQHHLHSTMFIFISISIASSKHIKCIYIPLCLYLYAPTIRIFALSTWFTFHYVYIYIFLEPNNHTIINEFTFHYVYIYMFFRFSRLWNSIKHLHSPMFIFILSPTMFAEVSTKQFTFHYVYIYIFKRIITACIIIIYIPLCLYLYRAWITMQA